MKYIRIAALLLAAALCLLLPGSTLYQAGTQLPILMYHHLAEEGPFNSMTVSPASLRGDLQWLWDNGFTTLFPQDLVEIAAGRRAMPDRPVMVTFDDGYTSNYHLGFPILQETCTRAAFALLTCMTTTDNPDSWGMTWGMLQEMQDTGLCTFGSHTTALHDDSTSQGLVRLEGEDKETYLARITADLLYSKNKMEDRLGTDCIYLAYPYGKSDPWLVEWLTETGSFPVTVTTTRALADLEDGLLGLKRIRMSMTEHPYNRADIRAIAAQPLALAPAEIALTAEGRTVTAAGFTANGRGAVSLASLARALQGTRWQFDFSENPDGSLTLLPGSPYSGSDAAPPTDLPDRTDPCNCRVTLGDRTLPATGYRLGDSWYFRPDALADLLGYTVTGAGTVLEIG